MIPVSATRLSCIGDQTDVQMSKKRKLDHFHTRLRPTTNRSLSLPSTSNIPSLPHETFVNILNHLQDDKHSLAQCMQVSTTFNEIAAPLIYRTVTLVSGELNPYDINRGDPVPARLSTDAAANIEHIKNVIVDSKSVYMDYFLKKVFRIDSLRLPIAILSGARHCTMCAKGRDMYGKTWGHCTFLTMYRPKKLVVHGSGIDTACFIVTGFRDLVALVYLISPTYESTGFVTAIRNPPSSTKIERVVQVFWTESPLIYAGISPGTQCVGGQHSTEIPIPDYVGTFCASLKSIIQYHKILNEITIVNGDGLHHVAVSLSAKSTRRQISARLQNMIKDRLSDVRGVDVEQRPDRLIVNYDNRVIDIRFMSLPDYLETHDWSGEFTQAEVKYGSRRTRSPRSIESSRNLRRSESTRSCPTLTGR